MNTRFFRSLQLSLALFDFLTINIVFFLLKLIFSKELLITSAIEYGYFIVWLNIVWLVLAFLKNIYHHNYIASFEKFTKISMQAYTVLLLIIILGLFFLRITALSRIFVTAVLAGIWLGLLANRLVYFIIHQYFRKQDWLVNKVIIIGYNHLSKKLADYLTASSINKTVIGFCEESDKVDELSQYPILSNISGAVSICKQHNITEIYSTIAPEHNPDLYRLIQNADDNCIRFKIVPDLGFFLKKQMYIDYIQEIPVISLRREPLEDLGNRIKKRLFDIAVSLFVVVFILSWLIPIIGLLIMLESKGGILFAQPRTGKGNKTFRCYKFRSMRVNRNADAQQATRNDSRITKVGAFLRRTSLDEFLQFINVLKGDMSISGPRPHMLKHTNEYAKLVEQYMVRQLLKPGITGWAQVNGFRGETQTVRQMQKRVEYDLWYMENWSLLLDMKIMVMTVINTLKGEENAF